MQNSDGVTAVHGNRDRCVRKSSDREVVVLKSMLIIGFSLTSHIIEVIFPRNHGQEEMLCTPIRTVVCIHKMVAKRVQPRLRLLWQVEIVLLITLPLTYCII